jgi:hypothetical protein
MRTRLSSSARVAVVWIRQVDHRPAVLAANGEALQHAQRDQHHGRRDADGLVVRQDSDQRGRCAHDDDGGEEGLLSAHQVAESAEHQCSERPHRETGGKGEQREDERARLVDTREELLRDDCGERTVQEEVVPLEAGAEARCKDHTRVRLGRPGSGRHARIEHLFSRLTRTGILGCRAATS